MKKKDSRKIMLETTKKLKIILIFALKILFFYITIFVKFLFFKFKLCSTKINIFVYI